MISILNKKTDYLDETNMTLQEVLTKKIKKIETYGRTITTSHVFCAHKNYEAMHRELGLRKALLRETIRAFCYSNLLVPLVTKEVE